MLRSSPSSHGSALRFPVNPRSELKLLLLLTRSVGWVTSPARTSGPRRGVRHRYSYGICVATNGLAIVMILAFRAHFKALNRKPKGGTGEGFPQASRAMVPFVVARTRWLGGGSGENRRAGGYSGMWSQEGVVDRAVDARY